MAQFHAARLADLGKTPEEVKKELAPVAVLSDAVKPSTPVYPYGTCISLNDDVLAKVMPGEMPPVGAMVHGCFVGMVKACCPPTERIDADGKKTSSGACVEIEIQHLGFAAEDDVDRQQDAEEKQTKTWYGGKEPDGDEE